MILKEMSNPLISIIMPVYNGEKYLREALDSALNQTYSNYEIIVVNDGSTDDTGVIALSYGDKIRYFEKPNGGVSSALNLGIEVMRGDYFSWLSHDDRYFPDKLQLEIEELINNPDVSAVYSDYAYIDSTGNKYYYPKLIESLGFKDICNNGLCAVTFNIINGLSLLIPKELLLKYGKFDENLKAVQDYKKWYELFKNKKLAYIDKPLVQSRRHNEQVTVTYSGMKDECESLFLEIISNSSQDDLNNCCLSLYSYYQKALVHFGRTAFYKVRDYAISRLIQMKDEDNVREKLDSFKIWIKKITLNKDIYLYCAGNQGKALIDELILREIEVVSITDSDSCLWGKNICGLKCISPEYVPKDATVIVTKREGNDVAENLKKKGYKSVILNEDIQGMIFKTPVPIKNIMKYYKH